MTEKQRKIRKYLEDLYKECLYYIEVLEFVKEYLPLEPNKPDNLDFILKSASKILEKAKFKKRQFDDPTFYYYANIKRCYDNYEECENVAIQFKGDFCSSYIDDVKLLESLQFHKREDGLKPYAIYFKCEFKKSLEEISPNSIHIIDQCASNDNIVDILITLEKEEEILKYKKQYKIRYNDKRYEAWLSRDEIIEKGVTNRSIDASKKNLNQNTNNE